MTVIWCCWTVLLICVSITHHPYSRRTDASLLPNAVIYYLTGYVCVEWINATFSTTLSSLRIEFLQKTKRNVFVLWMWKMCLLWMNGSCVLYTWLKSRLRSDRLIQLLIDWLGLVFTVAVGNPAALSEPQMEEREWIHQPGRFRTKQPCCSPCPWLLLPSVSSLFTFLIHSFYSHAFRSHSLKTVRMTTNLFTPLGFFVQLPFTLRESFELSWMQWDQATWYE